MNKKKFLDVLNRKLRHLPKEDRADAIAYYEEYFAEMNLGEDEDVTLQVGQPANIARDILGNCTEKHLDKQKAVKSILTEKKMEKCIRKFSIGRKAFL